MAQTAFILLLLDDADRAERVAELLRARAQAPRVAHSLTDALESVRDRSPDVVVAQPVIAGEPVAAALGGALATASRDAALLLLLGKAPAEALAAPGVTITYIPETDDAEKLAAAIDRAATHAVSRRHDRLMEAALSVPEYSAFHGIVGVSRSMQRIVERIKKAAKNKLTVLILGETGTGKDLIAEAIHQVSDRSRRPFKALNCAGVTESLLESELFGHVRGAFTGAVKDHNGFFVAADGGTLFLDEVGDMPLGMQAKLLRALDRREITPVGSTEVRRVDVRVIAATNADIQRLIQEKKFREDLYFRLHGFEIRVPPLRERREDIPVLIDYFLKQANLRHKVSVPGISSEAMGVLARYFWPGNVRELATTIESAAVEATDRRIEVDDLPERVRGSREIVPLAGGLAGLTMDQIQKIAIMSALKTSRGNREEAAKMLGIGTRTLYRKIKEYGL